MVRLFIYHVEANDLESPIKEAFLSQYSLMERRLANIITTPGMLLSISMAICLLWVQPQWLQQGWMQLKLILVGGLVVYHLFFVSNLKVTPRLHDILLGFTAIFIHLFKELCIIIMVGNNAKHPSLPY